MQSATSEIVKKLRSFGLSQSEIQRRTGIPQSRVSRWENGMVPDAADDALKLQHLLSDLECVQASEVPVEGSADGNPH